MGDYVKVVAGSYAGWYAVVQDDGYGDELEVNYFKEVVGSVLVDGHRYSRYWVLNENDLDSLERKDMLKVKEFVVDGRYNFIFLS